MKLHLALDDSPKIHNTVTAEITREDLKRDPDMFWEMYLKPMFEHCLRDFLKPEPSRHP
jgi:hypothetical protein